MSNISKRRKEGSRTKIKSMGDHKEFLKRITKTLYYGQLPTLPCLSLPVTEISCELWSVSQRGRSLRRLHADAAAGIARSACVSPCALVLAILYLERLNSCNPDYLAAAAPADLFLVSLMVGNKFLQDDGEDDDVICSEWAASGGLELAQLKKLEVEFLNAIDWNVFVSDKSFEAGLSWLERRVALRQARRRGFFTYAVLASALLLARARLPAVRAHLAAVATRAAFDAPHANTMTYRLRPESAPYMNDTMVDLSTFNMLAEETVPDKFKCCTKWTRFRDSTTSKRNWYDTVVVYDWRSLEPWWSTTSVLNWLYQSSLVNPMQRWLDKLNEFAAGEARGCSSSGPDALAGAGAGAGCARAALNLSKLGALLASAADR